MKARSAPEVAQPIVRALTAPAHNTTVQGPRAAVERSTTAAKKVGRLGVMRLIRDVFRVSGRIHLSHAGRVAKFVRNRADPMGRAVAEALTALLAAEHVPVRLGEL